MFEGKRVAVIIAAAGKGSRLGASVPKQYLKIGGEYVISKAIKAFENTDTVDHIFVVAGEEQVERCRSIISDSGFTKTEEIVVGGERRQDSVFNAIQAMNRRRPGVEYVLIHDGARPFISEELIENVLRQTACTGAAVAGVAMKNSVRRLTDNVSQSVDRSDYISVQTPQGFRKSMLISAYEKAFDDGFCGSDDASIVEYAGGKISVVEGEYQNIKITTKDDLPMENRVGTGFDVHRLRSGRKLILGGVDIPWDKGLDGHSDADVLVHALMDALLGAAAMGDIGTLFPDTDSEYKGIDSLLLLKQVKDRLEDAFYKVGNVDVTVMAQRPKLRENIDLMRENIARCLDIDKARVSIKATTTEGLGFVGREEGIACEAVASIYR